jgi:hypothetical protein
LSCLWCYVAFGRYCVCRGMRFLVCSLSCCSLLAIMLGHISCRLICLFNPAVGLMVVFAVLAFGNARFLWGCLILLLLWCVRVFCSVRKSCFCSREHVPLFFF